MSEHARTVPVEILTQWEGPVIHEPGVLFDETQIDAPGAELDVGAVAGWVAVTALSEVNGNATLAAIRQKVLNVLSKLRQRFGQAKLDEIKQQLFALLEQERDNRKITDDALKERIQRLFSEVLA